MNAGISSTPVLFCSNAVRSAWKSRYSQSLSPKSCSLQTLWPNSTYVLDPLPNLGTHSTWHRPFESSSQVYVGLHRTWLCSTVTYDSCSPASSSSDRLAVRSISPLSTALTTTICHCFDCLIGDMPRILTKDCSSIKPHRH